MNGTEMPTIVAKTKTAIPAGAFRRWGGRLFAAAVLAARSAVICRNASELGRWHWNLNVLRFTLASLLVTASYPLFALAWRQALIACGAGMPAQTALRIFARSQLARYLPGSVWNFVGRAVMCGRAGVDRAAAVGSMVLENAAVIACALLVFAATLPFWPTGLHVSHRLELGLIAAVALVMLHPAVFARILRLAARVMRSELPDVDLSLRRIALLIAHYVTAWLVLGIGFWMFASSVQMLPLQSIPVLAGGFPLAWVIGFVTVFAPGGFGIREGVVALLLAAFMPVAVAGVIAVAFRLLQIVSELVWAAAVCTMVRESNTE